MTLRLALIGPMEITLAREPLPVYRKALSVLIYLAVERSRSFPRDELATLFWPEASRAAALGNLRYVLHRLREGLRDGGREPPYLQLRGDRIGFNAESAHSLDLDEFASAAAPYAGTDPAALEATAALYRGEFLEDMEFDPASAFGHWVEMRRAALRRQALSVLTTLSRVWEDRGEVPRALIHARRTAAIAVFDEEAQQRIMRLLALSGQHEAALTHYEAFCLRLRQEVDGVPGIATTHLAERIRAAAVPASLRTSLPAQLPNEPLELLERRYLTVLFCTFALSPAEADAARADAERMQERIIAVQQEARRCIADHGGHAMEMPGGFVLAYFGYPVAQEQAVRQGVAAALALAALRSAELLLHCGVHTGLALSSPAAPDKDGVTTGIAAKLCALNLPVAISEATRQRVAGYFEIEPLAAAAPVPAVAAYQVLGATGSQHRLDAARARGAVAAFVGRQSEMTALRRQWTAACAGEQRLVLLQGEAGIGKSRLIEAFIDELRDHEPQAWALRRMYAFQEFATTPFYPVVTALAAALGFAGDDTAAARREKLAAALGEDAARLQSHLADLLLPDGGAPPAALNLDSRQQRERRLQALVDLILRTAARQPTLVVFEDAHWADPSTLELYGRLARQAARLPLLLLVSARSGFAPPWAAQHMALHPLADAEIGALAAQLGADGESARYIAGRAGGNPLFAEAMVEMSRTTPAALIPTALSAAPGRVPPTLDDLLAAQLDTLGEHRYTAQMAAALGQEFELGLLREISPLDTAALDRSLSVLAQAHVLEPRGDTLYRFHHALIQDAAHRSLARKERVAIHRRIAQTLEARRAALAEERPELLAQHWGAAEEAGYAIHYWQAAAGRAVDHFAYGEAALHFAAALAQVASLTPGIARDRLEFSLLLNTARWEQRSQGYGQGRSMQLLGRALELAAAGAGSGRELFNAFWGLWEAASSTRGHGEGVRLAQRLLEIAQKEQDNSMLQEAVYAFGVSLFWQGELAAARERLERCIALQAGTDSFVPNPYGGSTLLMALAYLSWILWLQGSPVEAVALSEDSVARAQRWGNAGGITFALTFAAVLRRWLGQVDESLRRAEEGLAVAAGYQSTVFQASNVMSIGWAKVMQGDANAIVRIEQAVGVIRVALSGVAVSMLAPLGEAWLQLGETAKARAIVDEALGQAEALDDRYYLAELHRLKGLCLAADGDRNGARQCFDTALAVSRRQGATALAQRATDSLAELDGSRVPSDPLPPTRFP